VSLKSGHFAGFGLTADLGDTSEEAGVGSLERRWATAGLAWSFDGWKMSAAAGPIVHAATGGAWD
jgi:hypothetical protein